MNNGSGRGGDGVQLRPGYRLGGRYKLLYPYARGGMATVWLSRVRGSHGFEKLYAIKTILPHLASDPAFRNMFLDEAHIAARIRHGNVAEIEDLGEDGGILYMVLEWIQGDPWSKLCEAIVQSKDPMPEDVMLRIAAGTCAGLHAAHELRDDHGGLLNVVHRDVSPQNVLVTEAGTVKVIDFGVAKAIGRAGEQTRAGLIKGKLEYIAPEQARSKPVDRRVDIWAVGAILYEVFARRPAFEGKNDLILLQRIASGKPPEPLPKSTPPAVVDIVARALQPDPAKRFATAKELQHAIEAAMRSRVTPEDVAVCVRRYLEPRIADRRRAIAAALDEAAEMSMRIQDPALLVDRAPPPRGKLPTLPPEALAAGHRSAPPPGSAEPPAPPVAEPAAAPALAPRLRSSHKALLAVATLVTLVVWTLAILVALRTRERDAHERSGPAAGIDRASSAAQHAAS
jgi:serine/threonine-protein kinase